ncbi:complex I NDUFA9 subunit family protein [Pseudophaeobacter sp. EL27]|uniref:complex I NDUFA9 subunit family protein n=1 Tax=Pseudophaeobacter sp. EL27 TaxID=2107580 RepID=UPI000EFA867B|nr:complex I NDUFA9 subunit family protein [Pseudophaeobacter sp. EL27]
MSKLVTIYGGSGFVGRYIARRMAKDGWRVRVAVRRPNEAMHVKPYGAPGQVEPVLCNIRDDASVAAAMQGADAVVNCVGVLNAHGKNTFEAVQVDGAARVARIAHKQDIGQMVHISALGADAEGSSDYARTKALGEEAVRGYFPKAVILRPSVIFGTEDEFFNRFAGMASLSPLLPIAKGKTLFQPVYVDDVARAAVKAAKGDVAPGLYELGGPEVKSFAALMRQMCDVIMRRRVVLSLPGFAVWPLAFGFDMLQAMSLQLIENKVLSRDQLKSLGTDNVVSEGAKGFADLGITPERMGPILPSYLWKFRPSGQYDEMTASARNLKGDA